MSRPTEGIATDASHSAKLGKTRFRGIDLKSGAEIFHEDLGNRTINVGEFLGVVAAAKWIIEHGYTPRTIYTDSRTAIAWFREKRTGSRRKSADLFKAEVFLQTQSAAIDTIEVRHWDNVRWGEIPADFGLK
ncbi:ribonuclease H [Alistipes indistinctus]|uniref:ribonuclease H n=1 Tax=Alistipes indistinctus TaxID=626932 RepID=UPI003F10C918